MPAEANVVPLRLNPKHAPTRWVLLRGLGRERRHWFRFHEQLSRTLGVGCDLMDLPGVGSARYEIVPFSIKRTAEIVAARIEAAHGPRGSLGVLGLSLGGMVGLELCHCLPELVTHAVLVNSSSRLSPAWLRLSPSGIWLLAQSMLSRDAVEREKHIYELTLGKKAGHAAEYASVAAGFQTQHPVTRSLILKQLLAASGFMPAPIRQPVLVLSARNDRLVSPSCSVDLATFLGAMHVEHETAGHDLPLEEPEWVARQVHDWLVSPESQPPSSK